MSDEQSRTLALRFFAEVFNQQNWETAAAILSPDFVAHHPQFPQGIVGIAGLQGVTAMFRGGFPDLEYTPEDIVVGGDRVVVRWTASGTHLGPMMGVSPTGRRVVVTGIDIFRVAGGKLAETWVASDILGLLQQIGAVPPAGEGPPS